MTPAETKTLTTKVNKELAQFNDGIQTRIPLDALTAVFRDNDLDAKPIQNNLHGDEGRMHVNVGNDIYFVMSWYRFTNTGRYEIVCRVTSQHDDHREPYSVVMDASAKNKAKRAVNNALAPFNKMYPKHLGDVRKQVSDILEKSGFDAHDFDHAQMNGKTGHVHVPIGNGIFISFSYYQMDVSGNWEIVTSVS